MAEKETGTTMKYCLIGHPVSHSISPRLHNNAFTALKINAVYSLCDTGEKGLLAVVKELKEENFLGWNVTMPDKTAMCALCDELSEESKIGQSVNTVKNEHGRLFGTTTDGAGFLAAVQGMGISLCGNALTLLGGGGAASSILIAAAIGGASSIAVFVRGKESRIRMEQIKERLSGKCPCRISFYNFSDTGAMKEAIRDSVLLANATNIGMGPQEGKSPVPDASFFVPSAAVFDAIYYPRQTSLLNEAKKAGCLTANGLPMLIGQAAASFKIWTGQDMPSVSPNLF